MKQNILYTNSAAVDESEELCLGGLLVRWALFGMAMWWLSGVVGDAFGWLIGLAAGCALVRREFGA